MWFVRRRWAMSRIRASQSRRDMRWFSTRVQTQFLGITQRSRIVIDRSGTFPFTQSSSINADCNRELSPSREVSHLKFIHLRSCMVPVVLFDLTGTVTFKKETWQQDETSRIWYCNCGSFFVLHRKFYIWCNFFLCWYRNVAWLLSLIFINSANSVL